jgi:hypothetical protein
MTHPINRNQSSTHAVIPIPGSSVPLFSNVSTNKKKRKKRNKMAKKSRKANRR